jgi:pilus assembly protein CpaB
VSRRGRAAVLLVLALALGLVAARDVGRREAAIQAQLAPLVAVVVTRAELPAGRTLAPADLAVREIPARYAPPGAAGVPEALLGRRLAAALPRGAVLGPGTLARTAAASAVGAAVRAGERAVEVVGLGDPALVVAGARVDVLVTHDAQGDEPAGTRVALEDAEVLAARRLPADAHPRDDGAPQVAATLRVPATAAVALAAAQSFAREVRLLPRAPGDRGRVR